MIRYPTIERDDVYLCKDSSAPHLADQGKTVILMNLKLFYPWLRCISSHFPSFTVWQHKRLALASLGILLAEHGSGEICGYGNFREI